MTSKQDPLSLALEELRHRPIVSDSRDYAQQWERSSGRWHRARTTALRTLAAVTVVSFAVFLAAPRISMTTTPFARDVYETEIGETRSVTLEDGSRIMLDTNSRVRVAFSATERDVELLDGQAHFDVAKNPKRPFRVRTALAEVVAVGTSFDVAARPSHTTVTLIEGRVNVRSVVTGPGTQSQPESLIPGQQLAIARDGHFLEKKPVRLASVTSWQRGTISLDDVPLSEALATLNRYSATKIVIEDDSLQMRRVSGVFVIGDVETEALVLRRFLGLQERSRSRERIVLAVDEHRSFASP
jgi:transmembrane sensor